MRDGRQVAGVGGTGGVERVTVCVQRLSQTTSVIVQISSFNGKRVFDLSLPV